MRDTSFCAAIPAFQLMGATIPEFFKAPVCAAIVHITPTADAAFDFPREEGFLVDDRLMRIFNIIPRKFSPVLLPLLEDWIRHIFLLEKHIAGIGNIGQDNPDVGIHPAAAIPGRDAFGSKFPFGFKT